MQYAVGRVIRRSITSITVTKPSENAGDINMNAKKRREKMGLGNERYSV